MVQMLQLNKNCSRKLRQVVKTQKPIQKQVMMSSVHGSLVLTKPDGDKRAKTKYNEELSLSSQLGEGASHLQLSYNCQIGDV